MGVFCGRIIVAGVCNDQSENKKDLFYFEHELKFIKERNLPDAWTLIEYDMAMNQVATMEVMDSSVFLEALHVSISIDIS